MKQHPSGSILVWLSSAIVLVIALSAGALAGSTHYIKQRNLAVATIPPTDEFVVAYERGLDWVLANNEQITNGPNKNNTWLWWMLQQTANLQQDEALQALITGHVNNIKDRWGIHNLWPVLFDTNGKHADLEVGFANASYYAKLTTYGVTGDPEMTSDAMVAAQFSADFCSTHLEMLDDKACLTHQLLGHHFVLKNNYCPTGIDCALLIEDLQLQIQAKLESDPLVDDVYLQRVLMLKLTNREDLIKPIWLQRILDKQNPDNGWTLFDCLIRVGENVCISAGGYGKPAYMPIFLTSGRSTFHATAQGLFLAALMIEN